MIAMFIGPLSAIEVAGLLNRKLLGQAVREINAPATELESLVNVCVMFVDRKVEMSSRDKAIGAIRARSTPSDELFFQGYKLSELEQERNSETRYFLMICLARCSNWPFVS